MYDTWLLGDAFLRETYPTLQAIKAQSKVKRKPPLYLYDYFNVIPLYQKILCNIRSAEARMINALISMLNSRDHLPMYLIVIPDRDLLSWYGHPGYGISRIIQKNLNHMISDIEKILRTHREDLMQKRPGAAGDKTTIIWVKMIKRPIVSMPLDTRGINVFQQSSKFNFVMQETLADRSECILEIQHLKNFHFDRYGNLNAEGKTQFWRELDFIIKRFNRKEIKLQATKLHDEM